MANLAVVIFIGLTGLAGALHRNQAVHSEITLQGCKSTCQRFGMSALAEQNGAFSGVKTPQECVQICDQEYASALLQAKESLKPHTHEKTFTSLKELEEKKPKKHKKNKKMEKQDGDEKDSEAWGDLEDTPQKEEDIQEKEEARKAKRQRKKARKEKREKTQDPDDVPRTDVEGNTPIETTTADPNEAHVDPDSEGGSATDPKGTDDSPDAKEKEEGSDSDSTTEKGSDSDSTTEKKDSDSVDSTTEKGSDSDAKDSDGSTTSEPKKKKDKKKKNKDKKKKKDSDDGWGDDSGNDGWGDDDDSDSDAPFPWADGDDWGMGGPVETTTTTPATLAGEEWVRPFSLTNGACEHVDPMAGQKTDRYVMEIREVAGGSYYLGEIGFGTPEQTLNMLLDTGSDEIVIKSNDCYGCKGRGYDSNRSSTYLNETNGPDKGLTSMSYGSGDVIGQRGFDTVHTGPLSGPNLPIVWVLESNIDMFQDESKDALEVIVGMAPGLREYVGERLASSMKVRRISQCLPNNPNENGFFVVNDGKVDSSARGPFNSVGGYYWAAGIQNFRMEWEAGQSTHKEPVLLGKPFVGIVDTGTTLLSIPQQTMDELTEQLGMLDFDCSRMGELPDLKFDIDGETHFLPPKAYIAEASNSQSYVKRLMHAHKSLPSLKVSEHAHTAEEAAYFSSVTEKLYFKKPFLNLKKGVQCMLLFTDPLGMDTPEGELAILGMPFFREYAIHFDFCSRQMWTSRSYGDCHRNIGQHPTNVDWCADKDWLTCWSEGVGDFGRAFADGVTSIFTNRERPLPKARKIQRQGGKAGSTEGLLQLDPKEIRLSEAAKWITSTNTQGGMVSI